MCVWKGGGAYLSSPRLPLGCVCGREGGENLGFPKYIWKRKERGFSNLGKENFCIICQQLSKATSLLNEAQQPYNYLIESIKARDTQNQTLTERLELMEEDVRSVKYQ